MYVLVSIYFNSAWIHIYKHDETYLMFELKKRIRIFNISFKFATSLSTYTHNLDF
jgi:hypothetical protein